MNWAEAYDLVTPHIYQISHPAASGTGFLLTNLPTTEVIGIATAAHVVEHPDHWQQPIRIRNYSDGTQILVPYGERAIFIDKSMDTAVIVVPKMKELTAHSSSLPLIPKDRGIKIGSEIAWFGFPSVAPQYLCFFEGHVSGRIDSERTYLVDGVVISGVSGGPAFYKPEHGDIPLVCIGVVSAYMPNRNWGEATPGLSVIRDVMHLQSVAEALTSMEEAKAKEKQEVILQAVPTEETIIQEEPKNDGK
jgi:hypothetical protein